MARDSKGRFTKKKTRRNLEGFMSGGKFRPIRGSEGYSERKAGDTAPPGTARLKRKKKLAGIK